MNNQIDRQVDSNACPQDLFYGHPVRLPDLIEGEIAVQPTEPILRSASTPATELLASGTTVTARAPHSETAPQWQSPEPKKPVTGEATASPNSCLQSSSRQSHAVFKAADGTEAPPEVQVRLELLTGALSCKSGKSFEAAVRDLGLDNLKDELKYLDGTLLKNLIHAGSTKIVEHFLYCFRRESSRFINGPSRDGQFDALSAAAANNDVEMGLVLFGAGARPENYDSIPEKFWNALLEKAVAKNCRRSVELLMCLGDPELVRKLPRLPTHVSLNREQYELNPSKAITFHLQEGNQRQLTSIFSVMFDRAGADEAASIFTQFLLLAINEGQLDNLKLLIAAEPAEMKSLKPSMFLEHLMQDVAIAGNAQVLEVLLDYHPLIRPNRNEEWAFSGFRNFFDDKVSFSGRAINKEDEHGNTLLHLAASSRSAATMALLLDRGADGEKILEQARQRLRSPAATGSRSSQRFTAWILDYLSMKSAKRGLENKNAPWIVQAALSRIANDVTRLETALSGRIGGPTAAQSTMVKAGILAQSNVPDFLASANPYQDARLDNATAGELNQYLATWSLKRVVAGEAMEAPFRKLISDLWEVSSRHDMNDAQIGKPLKIDLLEHGMYGLVADCVVAAFTAAVSHGHLGATENGKRKAFAGALKREIWLNPERSRQRDEASRASTNPVLFDALMHRQLYVVEQYCEHYLASAGAPLGGN